MNYTLSEIARICGGTFTGENRRVTEVVTDSRSCGMPAAPLFVAMCGARHDSHDFVDGMYARGVRAFLVERPLDERDGAGYVVVGNAIDALQRLAGRLAPPFRRYGGGDHRLERQDGRQGVDRPDGARRREAVPLAAQLQFAAGGGVVAADDRGRRTVRADRGGYLAAGRNGPAGTDDLPRRRALHFAGRRASGAFRVGGGEVRRETVAGASCTENHLSQRLRAAGFDAARGLCRGARTPRCGGGGGRRTGRRGFGAQFAAGGGLLAGGGGAGARFRAVAARGDAGSK